MNLIELMEDEEIRDRVTSKAEENVVIHNDDEADEVLAQMIWATEKIAGNKALVKKKAQQLKEALVTYEKRLNGSLERYLENRQRDLEMYLNSRLDGGKGSIKLFHGTVSMREDTGRTVIDDEDAVIQYLKSSGHENCITVKESVSRTALKKAFRKDPSGRCFLDEDGNILQGAHIDKEEGLHAAIRPAKIRKVQEEKEVA